MNFNPIVAKAPGRAAVIVLSALLILPALNSCKQPARSSGGERKIRVITTLFPLYDMAKNIGADRAEVFLLLPPGIEAHLFEPGPADIIRINEADIFIYTGGLMEPWAEKLLRGIIRKDLIVVNAGKGITLIPEVGQNGKKTSGSADPHIWLDFANAGIMAENILRGFLGMDSFAGDYYRQKAAVYKEKLAELDSAYKSAMEGCKRKEIFYAGHYAFGYMADRYGLRYLAAQGVSPDAEPTASDMVSLVKQIKQYKTGYVFYEELSSPRIAKTIADETGAKLLLLNAAHNLTKEQFDAGISFADIMYRDLEALKTALQCR